MKTIRKATPLVLIATLVTGFSATAQIFDKTKGKNVEKLLTQTTTVLSFDTGAYTNRLKTAFTDHWKITPVVFKDSKNGDFTAAPESPVFMPVVIGLRIRDHETSMNNPFYVFAGTGSSGRVNAEHIVAAFPINGFHYEFDVTGKNMYSRSLLRIPYMVYTLNEMLTYLKTNGDDKGYLKSIGEKNSRIAGKTLLIPSELTKEWDVNPNTTAMMKANLEAGLKPMKEIMASVLDPGAISFAGKYKILSTEEILKLENSEDAGRYTLFLPAIDNKKYMMVYDLKTKELLYFETVTMGMRIKDKDFDKLNKAVGL